MKKIISLILFAIRIFYISFVFIFVIPILRFIDPMLVKKEIRDKLSKFEKIIRLIKTPIFIILLLSFRWIIINYSYRETLIFFLLSYLLNTFLSDLSHYRQFKKINFWSELISVNIFNCFLWIAIFDILS